MGINSFGIEQNLNQIKLMKKEKIKAYQSVNNLLNKEGENTKFSIISLNQVIEHVNNPKEILKNLRNISNNDCILYISVPPYLKRIILLMMMFSKRPL